VRVGTWRRRDILIDRWYVKTDKASGIVNDVNQWGLEKGNPRYIIDLIKRVVTVSLPHGRDPGLSPEAPVRRGRRARRG
jgi:predicted helicase